MKFSQNEKVLAGYPHPYRYIILLGIRSHVISTAVIGDMLWYFDCDALPRRTRNIVRYLEFEFDIIPVYERQCKQNSQCDYEEGNRNYYKCKTKWASVIKQICVWISYIMVMLLRLILASCWICGNIVDSTCPFESIDKDSCWIWCQLKPGWDSYGIFSLKNQGVDIKCISRLCVLSVTAVVLFGSLLIHNGWYCTLFEHMALVATLNHVVNLGTFISAFRALVQSQNMPCMQASNGFDQHQLHSSTWCGTKTIAILCQLI